MIVNCDYLQGFLSFGFAVSRFEFRGPVDDGGPNFHALRATSNTSTGRLRFATLVNVTPPANPTSHPGLRAIRGFLQFLKPTLSGVHVSFHQHHASSFGEHQSWTHPSTRGQGLERGLVTVTRKLQAKQ
jgi:hypothetical protein